MLSGADRDRADGLLRPAQESSYRLPSTFAGLTALLRTDQAEVPVRVTVRNPQDLVLEEPDDFPAQVVESLLWAKGELGSMFGHRWPSAYDEGDGQRDKQIDAAAATAAGELVSLVGGPMESAYRVQAGHLTEVHRTTGNWQFTIVIGARSRVPDGRWLATAFSVYHWNLDDNGSARTLHHVDTYIDSFAELDGVWLPTGRRITTGDHAGLHTRELALSDHALLEA